ncbi:MAG: hypothetical protein M3125_08930 [Gemmatimonadota bacterium]|nr:hypothetical protein [Gemmatimonadota bacterium]
MNTRRARIRSVLFCAAAVTSLACGPREPIPMTVTPAAATPMASWPDVVGCWQLRMSAWDPALMLGADERIITPPSRVLIDSTIGTRPYERRNLLLRPAPGAAPSVHRYSWWNLGRGDSIQLRWTTGFSGINMSLSHEGDTLRGVAETEWDFDRQRQLAAVTAWRVPCADAPTLAGDSLGRNIPFNPSMHVAERGSMRHYLAGRSVAREWWEVIRTGDSLAIVTRVESAGTTPPLVVTVRTDTAYVPRAFEVRGDEDATITVLGKRTRVGTGSTAQTVPTPETFFVLRTTPAISPWGALLRRWNRAERPARFSIPGSGAVRLAWRGRDSVLIGDRRIILERIGASGSGWGRRTLWTDTLGHLVASLGGLSGTFAVREGYEEAIPHLLSSARVDAFRVLRNAADDVSPTRTGRFAIVGATVLDGQRDAPLRNGVVLVEDGLIAEIGPRAQVKVPKGVPVIQGRGLTVIPGVREDGWSVSDLAWGPSALARGILAVRLSMQNDALLSDVRETLRRDGALAPRVLDATDSVSGRVLREGAPADFVVVQGTLREIPDSPSRVRWVAIGGKLYSGEALRSW